MQNAYCHSAVFDFVRNSKHLKLIYILSSQPHTHCATKEIPEQFRPQNNISSRQIAQIGEFSIKGPSPVLCGRLFYQSHQG